MKQIANLIISATCIVGLLSCQTDNTTTFIEESSTFLSVSLENTRIYLGEKDGKDYPTFWSEGDRIVVNGHASESAVINDTNKSSAVFEVKSDLSLPYSVTYPYSSALTYSSPKVVFPAEQEYVEETFAPNSVPMCGYVENEGDKIELKHLAGLLRFPVKASSDGIVLDRIVITSTDGIKLSGEFSVDCISATLSASESASNSITYTLPDNFVLSTSEESVFYISVPAIETGRCQVEFIEEGSEKKMTRYWDNKDIKAGIVREFKDITYNRNTVGELEAMTPEKDNFSIFYPTISGYVKDTNGNPIAGVAVSDGFQVVATDSKGYYSMDNITSDTWYIYISLPAEYEVPINDFGQPCFYKPYPSHTNQYDFTLTPLAGGKEKKFALFTIGDPQVRNTTQLARFNSEAVPGLYKHSQEVKSSGLPCYGITLGDIIANSDGVNTEHLRDDMRNGFHIDKAGLPVFQVYGNHDNTYYGSGTVINPDLRSSTIELKAQRGHEEFFGPANYSFNRGDVHIISMRNIVYHHNDTSGSYSEGFLEEQYKWLQQDLALVPKDKMVILCVHAPLIGDADHYAHEVKALLNEFDDAHIVSGHTHYSRNYEYVIEEPDTPYPHLYEHNVGALCGVWWRGNIAGDGAPCGYNVFVCDGNKFTESYFMGYNAGMDSKNTQMRLYRGNAVTGRARTDSDTYAGTGYYAFNFGEDVLIANIFNVDSKWVVKVFEDGNYTGNMEPVKIYRPSAGTMIGDYTWESPRRLPDGVVASVDMYTAGFYYNYYSGRNAWSICYHMYQYKLTKSDVKEIRVEATDRYNNTFTETKITEGTDYSLIAK